MSFKHGVVNDWAREWFCFGTNIVKYTIVNPNVTYNIAIDMLTSDG